MKFGALAVAAVALWLVITAAPPAAFSSTGVYVNFTFNAGADDIKSELKKEIDKIVALGRQAGIEKINMSGKGYSFSGYEGQENGPYGLSGYASLQISPADRAKEFLALLNEKGYQGQIMQQCGVRD